MAKRRSISYNGARSSSGTTATEEANDEVYRAERKVLFELISVRAAKCPKQITRLNAFLAAERQLSLDGDTLAIRHVETFTRIICRHCEEEAQIEQNPSGFAACKRKHEELVRRLTPLVAAIALSAAIKLADEHTKLHRLAEPAKPIRPYYIDEKAWERAEAQLKLIRRKSRTEDYEVGYKRPPKATQFRGSGNPAGRPKVASAWRQMQDFLEASVKIRTQEGSETEVKSQELRFVALWKQAMNKSTLARRDLMRRIIDLEERGLLSPLPKDPRRRRRKLKPSETQSRLISNGIKLCLSHTEQHLKPLYARKYGGQPAHNDIVDYEAGLTLEQDQHSGTVNKNKKKEGNHENESRTHSQTPIIRRKRTTLFKRSEEAGKDAWAGTKRGDRKTSK